MVIRPRLSIYSVPGVARYISERESVDYWHCTFRFVHPSVTQLRSIHRPVERKNCMETVFDSRQDTFLALSAISRSRTDRYERIVKCLFLHGRPSSLVIFSRSKIPQALPVSLYGIEIKNCVPLYSFFSYLSGVRNELFS